MFIYKIDNAISHHIMPSICMSPDNDHGIPWEHLIIHLQLRCRNDDTLAFSSKLGVLVFRDLRGYHNMVCQDSLLTVGILSVGCFGHITCLVCCCHKKFPTPV